MPAPQQELEQDAAMAAASLLKRLQHGCYLDNGKRRQIRGDFTKLIFAEGLTVHERKLLSDFRFRCQALPGLQTVGKFMWVALKRLVNQL